MARQPGFFDLLDRFEAWADLIVDICNGKARPKKQAEWRRAFEEACSRQQIEPDPALLDEWALRVWRKVISSRYIVSKVQTTFGRNAENAARREDTPLAFTSETLRSSGSGGSLDGSRMAEGSAAYTSIEWAGAKLSAGLAAGGQGRWRGQPAGQVRKLATAIGLAAPEIHID